MHYFRRKGSLSHIIDNNHPIVSGNNDVRIYLSAELHPMPGLSSNDKGRSLREKSIEQFFSMTETYQPNNVKRFNSLKPRRERKPRPKSSLALLTRHRYLSSVQCHNHVNFLSSVADAVEN